MTSTEVIGAELELVHRRELSLQATDLLSGLLGYDTTVADLTNRSSDDLPASPARLRAKRALRFMGDLVAPESDLAKFVGEDRDEQYAAAEAYVDFGADGKKYLEIADEYSLTPTQVTGVYALRQEVLDICRGTGVGFAELLSAVGKIGYRPDEIAYNAENIIGGLDHAGAFVETSPPRTLGENVNTTIFRPFRVAVDQTTGLPDANEFGVDLKDFE